jgi:hypothetical protein
MRATKKTERAFAKAAALLQQLGASSPSVELIDVKAAAREAHAKQFDVPKYFEAEAMLLFLEKPARFVLKTCKRCGEPFGSTYHAVGYCSDHCRQVAIQSQTGILWNPHKTPEERWGGEPPLILPVAAMLKLREIFGLGLQTQTETQNGGEELHAQEENLTPIFSAVEQSLHSEANLPQSPPEVVPVDTPEQTNPPELPVEEPQVDTPAEESVFDF